MSQSWKWFSLALNEVEDWGGQGALWEALEKCHTPRSNAHSGTGKIQPQSPSGYSWNNTAFCWALDPLSRLAGLLRIKVLLPPRGSQWGPGARGGPLGGRALLAWLQVTMGRWLKPVRGPSLEG